MQRIMVLGPPGSGKSTFAVQLGARHGLPVFHLDQAYWRPCWIEAPAQDFRAEVERIAALPAWVIDGNYADIFAPRLHAADTVIYLDVSAWRSVLRIVRRVLAHRGQVRPDSAPGCAERFNLGFLRFAANWNRFNRARILTIVEDFPGRRIIVRDTAGLRRLTRPEPGPDR